MSDLSQAQPAEQEIIDDPHEVEACYDDGESWRLVCSCGWEVWGHAFKARVLALHALHCKNPVPDDPFEGWPGER